MSGNELPKVLAKSQADIDAAIEAIKVSDIPPAPRISLYPVLNSLSGYQGLYLNIKSNFQTCVSSFLASAGERRKKRVMALVS